MCPNCRASSFSRQRHGTDHISPRFGNCSRWQVALDDRVVGNVYEAEAGDNGWVWYTSAEKCECGSGFSNMGFASGRVEMYHEPHPVKVEFDDGSYVIVTCPEMHLGTYNVYKHPTPPGETPDLETIMSRLEEVRAELAEI